MYCIVIEYINVKFCFVFVLWSALQVGYNVFLSVSVCWNPGLALAALTAAISALSACEVCAFVAFVCAICCCACCCHCDCGAVSESLPPLLRLLL